MCVEEFYVHVCVCPLGHPLLKGYVCWGGSMCVCGGPLGPPQLKGHMCLAGGLSVCGGRGGPLSTIAWCFFLELVYRSGWPPACSSPASKPSHVLGLQVCAWMNTTMLVCNCLLELYVEEPGYISVVERLPSMWGALGSILSVDRVGIY